MGAKTWMLVYANGNAKEILRTNPRLNREDTSALAGRLFPSENLEPLEDGDLCFTCPPDNELAVGCFPGLSIVAAKEFGIDYPSKLAPNFVSEGPSGTLYLHAMHSAVDWFAYAIWNKGRLTRSLSLSPDSGILENVGAKLPFEEPYWSGKHPVFDSEEEESDYPLPFHPLELGEAALLELFGYQLEGPSGHVLFEPERIPLVRFKRSKASWKFW